LEAEVFLQGQWKNFDEIEENLTLEELQAILGAARDKEYRGQKFTAALKGIDLDEKMGNNDSSFDDVKRRAEAKLTGVSEEHLEFSSIGIAVEEE
jgi:hypothetical protein